MSSPNSICWGTKAETLDSLRGLLKQGVILPAVHFTQQQWQVAPSVCLAQIRQLAVPLVIVRSSAKNEDAATQSLAGAYTSCLNVALASDSELVAAISRVINSFGLQSDPDNQILVQPMITSVQMSGVMMTHDIQHGAPYYSVNYDDESGVTDTITGGTSIQKTVLIHRNTGLVSLKSERLRYVISVAKELEQLCGHVPLDIEFAVDAALTVYIFQVRRITICNRWHPVTERRVARQLAHVSQFLQTHLAAKKGVFGQRSILGSMPDWNPAEIIGCFTRPLASSLYSYLVTESTWSLARAKVGYHHVRFHPLMCVIGYHPYIDVRASFNSFLPRGIAADTAEHLINAWINYLAAHPEYHDKVEFEVAQTCLDFEFDEVFYRRFGDSLGHSALLAYRECLSRLTVDAITGRCEGNLDQALKVIQLHEQNQHSQSRITAFSELAILLQNCRDIGVLNFAMIARHAFIAEALMRSAVNKGALSRCRLQAWKQSIKTVSYAFTQNYDAVLSGTQAKAEFLAQYGHLRPGTYDITSLRYDERVDLFKTQTHYRPLTRNTEVDFIWDAAELAALQTLIAAESWSISASQLIAYAERAIASREYAKLVFTRDLSNTLALLTSWGNEVGLSRDDLSFLTIDRLLHLNVSPLLDDPDRILLKEAEEARHRYEQAALLKLSHLIVSHDDIYIVPLHRAMPNFITEQYVEADMCLLNATSGTAIDLSGKMVCIENADPGYDWIFVHNIAGLITKFGGTNSHMAIRCAEHQVPAAIGCGEQLFNSLLNHRKIVLNCRDKKVVMV